MDKKESNEYQAVREGIGYFEQKRGLIEVSGKEAVQFLNGLITNDVAKLENDRQMYAAFPNAQGRLLAIVRVIKKDDKFLFETEETTHAAVFNNLFRFTYAGDFFVKDLSNDYRFFHIFNSKFQTANSDYIKFQSSSGINVFVPNDSVQKFSNELKARNGVEISEKVYETLRIENGIPLYGVDMDETTIVSEINLPDVISYNKGCYIGQEIIARIHFRGHVAKKLTGLIFEDENASVNPNDEIKSSEGKNAGRITSVTFSPTLEKTIALAYVRYDYLAAHTKLTINDFTASVKDLPFVEQI